MEGTPRVGFHPMYASVEFHCIFSDHSELFVPVHVQRWTVLPLHWVHVGCIYNCWTSAGLHQR